MPLPGASARRHSCQGQVSLAHLLLPYTLPYTLAIFASPQLPLWQPQGDFRSQHSTHLTPQLSLLLPPPLLHRHAAFPKAPAQAGSSEAANRWPGAYTGGPEATIWRRPVILLLGDSITQMGSNEYDGAPGWVAHMQAHYNRKVRALVGVRMAAVLRRQGAAGRWGTLKGEGAAEP